MSYKNISFGQFGDHRDDYSGPDYPYTRQEVYQPDGSKNRFALEESYGNVSARRIGKPDEILPGGRPAKQLAGGLSVWGGGSGSPEGHKEILKVDVRRGFEGTGLASAMLRMAADRHPNLSHSPALSAEGARYAMRNPLPGDTENTKRSVMRNAVADSATAMLGGPRRTGYT